MKNLSDQPTFEELKNRIENLPPDCKAQWGKMNAAQMMAHLQWPLQAALSDKPMPRMLLGRLIGWIFKKKLYNDDAWKPGLPTAKEFMVADDRDFENEKKLLQQKVAAFYAAGKDGIGNFVHPMFGKMTKDQWGMSAYKHIDHHLRQFGG
jgi:hypothetical protein